MPVFTLDSLEMNSDELEAMRVCVCVCVCVCVSGQRDSDVDH